MGSENAQSLEGKGKGKGVKSLAHVAILLSSTEAEEAVALAASFLSCWTWGILDAIGVLPVVVPF